MLNLGARWWRPLRLKVRAVAVDCDALELAVERPVVVHGPVLRDPVVPKRNLGENERE